MWLVTGPFDGEASGEVDFKKTKLLKTGTKYGVGRKERPLLINHKKVSHEHAEFVVGPHTQEDVSNPQIIPKLEFCNIKNKQTTLKRGEDVIVINPSATQELQDSDVIILVIGVLITVQWLPVCCYMPALRGKQSISTEACASLGISIVYNPDHHMTHHATSTYAVTTSIAHSLLLAAQFVKSEWLTEVIRLGNLLVNNDPSNGVSLEQTFALPPVTKYRPSFSPALPPSLKVFKVWEPNEERFNMFKGHRFMCVDEKPNAELREMIRRGGGEFEAFIVSGGKQKFHHALSKAKRVTSDAVGSGKGLVLVADDEAIKTAVDPDLWQGLLAEAKSFGLRFIPVENLLQSILNVDISHIDSTFKGTEEDGQRSSSPLPDFVPNTHPDEPSIVPAGPSQDVSSQPPRQLRRRAPTPTAAIRPPSPPAADDQADEIEPPRPPRRALTRRAKVVVTGIDDPSLLLSNEPNTSAFMEPPTAVPVTSSTPAAPIPGRSSRLKRRAGTAASQALAINEMDEIKGEPSLKKFKALFEASDPDRATADEPGSYEGGASQNLPQSFTQTQTQVRGKTLLSGAHAEGLEAVREEEEESQAPGSLARAKRKAGILEDDGDVEMEDGRLRPSTKKRAIVNMNAVEPSGPTMNDPADPRSVRVPSTAKSAKVSKPGAPIGKPDTDAAFLKALASNKRGKKTEDSFDREFNKLKISKPDLGREEEEREWAVLGDFGDERNVRGNFMVVLEMDVYKKDGQSRERHGRVEWGSRPNFKKFKKKITAGDRKTVELVITQENDYGMGSAYWKGGNSQSQSQNDDFSSNQPGRSRAKLPTQTQTQTQKRKARAFVVDDSDEEVAQEIVPRASKAKATSRAASRAASQKPEALQPLFLDSDAEVEFPEHEDEVQTLQSIGTRRSTRGTGTKKKAAAAVVVDDDSDDGATFKGFGKKKGARR